MTAVVSAPDTTTRYACTECSSAPFVNQRAVSSHQARRHGLRGEARSGKTVLVQVPLQGPTVAPKPEYPGAEVLAGYHVSALRLPHGQVAQLDALVAQRGGGNRSELVREAVAFFLAATDSVTWKERFIVEQRRRIAAEERTRRMQAAIAAEVSRLETIARG